MKQSPLLSSSERAQGLTCADRNHCAEKRLGPGSVLKKGLMGILNRNDGVGKEILTLRSIIQPEGQT